MSIPANNLNDAIVRKVDSILKNTDCIDSMYITVEGSRGEVPTITYRFREFIVPDDAEEDEK